jgi:opacity protein-like surface antigen
MNRMMVIKSLSCFCAVMFISGVTVCAHADQGEPMAPDDSGHMLKEVGILVGYGATSVQDKDDYVAIPFTARLGVDCDRYGLGFSDWVERGAALFHKKFRPAGETEFLMEPFISLVPSPDTNTEVGFIIALKYSWPLTERFHPYVFGGGGVMWISQHLHEQSTQYNFTPQIGGGFSYFLNKHVALNIEYRRRHFSNADIKLPNDGVNLDMVYTGVSWFY